MSTDWYEQTRDEFMRRWREPEPEPQPTPQPGTALPGYESFEDEMWERRKEFHAAWQPGGPHPVKWALDYLRQITKFIDVLLTYDRLSPEAIGFTARKVRNLIELLEQLEKKLKAKES